MARTNSKSSSKEDKKSPTGLLAAIFGTGQKTKGKNGASDGDSDENSKQEQEQEAKEEAEKAVAEQAADTNADIEEAAKAANKHVGSHDAEKSRQAANEDIRQAAREQLQAREAAKAQAAEQAQRENAEREAIQKQIDKTEGDVTEQIIDSLMLDNRDYISGKVNPDNSVEYTVMTKDTSRPPDQYDDPISKHRQRNGDGLDPTKPGYVQRNSIGAVHPQQKLPVVDNTPPMSRKQAERTYEYMIAKAQGKINPENSPIWHSYITSSEIGPTQEAPEIPDSVALETYRAVEVSPLLGIQYDTNGVPLGKKVWGGDADRFSRTMQKQTLGHTRNGRKGITLPEERAAEIDEVAKFHSQQNWLQSRTVESKDYDERFEKGDAVSTELPLPMPSTLGKTFAKGIVNKGIKGAMRDVAIKRQIDAASKKAAQTTREKLMGVFPATARQGAIQGTENVLKGAGNELTHPSDGTWDYGVRDGIADFTSGILGAGFRRGKGSIVGTNNKTGETLYDLMSQNAISGAKSSIRGDFRSNPDKTLVNNAGKSMRSYAKKKALDEFWKRQLIPQ